MGATPVSFKRPAGRHLASWVLGAVLAGLLSGCASLSGPAVQAGDRAPPSAAPTAANPDHPTTNPPKRLDESATAPALASAAGTEAGAPEGATPPALEPPRDLWERIRRGFAMPDLEGSLVDQFERTLAARPQETARLAARAEPYLFHIVEEIERRGLPMELALLPFVESAFNPKAVSPAKAAGMWQFMPATGRDFELRQNLFRDDRRNVLASTRAALDYLTRLHGQFGDWHLALAAYNWGEGNVARAQNRNRAADRETDYESLRMPDETRRYVPRLQAFKNLVLQPQAFQVVLPPIDNHPYFATVDIDRDIDVALAAKLAELPLDRFMALNPEHNKPVIFAAGSPQVLLPWDNAALFLANLRSHRGPLASWTAWTTPAALSTTEAARRLGLEESELREINRIPRRMLIRAGSTLLVPRNDRQAHVDVAESVAHTASLSLAPLPGRKPAQAKGKARTTRTAKTPTQGAKGAPKVAAAPKVRAQPKRTPEVAGRSGSAVRVASDRPPPRQ